MKQRELTTIPADVIELAGGHNLALERRKGEDELKIFCQDGRMSLSVVLTDRPYGAGPDCRSQAAATSTSRPLGICTARHAFRTSPAHWATSISKPTTMSASMASECW
jgi:hypothetical protein